jgi:hypothetical protein
MEERSKISGSNERRITEGVSNIKTLSAEIVLGLYLVMVTLS